MIVNYDHKTFIVQATELNIKNEYFFRFIPFRVEEMPHFC